MRKVLIQPNGQSRTCSSYAVAQKRALKRKMYFLPAVLMMFAGTLFGKPVEEEPTRPRIVTGGVSVFVPVSNFVMHRVDRYMDGATGSLPLVGGGVGGFLDFRLHDHVALQFNLQNSFEQQILRMDGKRNVLSNDNLQIQLLCIGKVFLPKGHLRLGAGISTNFIVASWLSDSPENNLYKTIVYVDPVTGEEFPAMHSTHTSACVLVGYEFPFGLQLNATYQISVENTFLYILEKSWIRPQQFTLGVAYRFR